MIRYVAMGDDLILLHLGILAGQADADGGGVEKGMGVAQIERDLKDRAGPDFILGSDRMGGQQARKTDQGSVDKRVGQRGGKRFALHIFTYVTKRSYSDCPRGKETPFYNSFKVILYYFFCAHKKKWNFREYSYLIFSTVAAGQRFNDRAPHS
jgi:hypothetical protein